MELSTKIIHHPSRPIGEILARQLPLPYIEPQLLTERLGGPAEASQWRALIATAMNAGPRPRDAYSRIMAALHYLARNGTCLHPLTQTRWRRLESLAALCGHRGDWQSRSGPVIGASNATLEAHLGITNVRRELRDLAAWGLIIPYQLKGNGHRYYGRRHVGDMVDASGWTLAPLVVLVDQLEELVEQDKEQRLLNVTLPKRITALLRSARNLLPRDLPTEMLAYAARIDALAHQRDGARRHSVGSLRETLDQADILLVEIQTALASAETDLSSKLSSRADAIGHDIYNITTPESVCNGSADDRSGDQGAPTPGPRKPELCANGASTDRFGIERSGFEWSEAEALFPALAGLIQWSQAPSPSDTTRLANMLQIDGRLCWRATQALGTPATALCLMLTAQHLADGQILKTPAAYFSGLIRKAQADDLNLGHTVFGRRKARTGPPTTNH